jgi:hypothetical protein
VVAIFNSDRERIHNDFDNILSKILSMSFSLRVDANQMQVFLIDSLDVTLQIHMFNISSLLNTPKIEKN